MVVIPVQKMLLMIAMEIEYVIVLISALMITQMIVIVMGSVIVTIFVMKIYIL